MFGSFDLFVEVMVFPDVEVGRLSCADIIDVIAALRRWEKEGTWKHL